MVYRKGERPVAKEVRAYTPDRPVAKWISGMAIEVVNLSAFPITISEIGFTIGRN